MNAEDTRKQISHIPEVMSWLAELGCPVEEIETFTVSQGMLGPYDMGDYYMHYLPAKGQNVTIGMTDKREHTRHFDVLTLQEVPT